MDAPGPEITVQLYQLLESKLASITLSIISTLLERNPLLRLTQEDVNFIKGSKYYQGIHEQAEESSTGKFLQSKL